MQNVSLTTNTVLNNDGGICCSTLPGTFPQPPCPDCEVGIVTGCVDPVFSLFKEEVSPLVGARGADCQVLLTVVFIMAIGDVGGTDVVATFCQSFERETLKSEGT